jgi:cytoskeleton protein RodZ
MGETVVTLPSNPTPTPSANAPSPTPAPTTVAAPIAPRPAETPQEAPTVPTAQLVAPAATPTEVASPALPNPTLPAPVTSAASSAAAPTPATPSTPKAVALELTFDEQAWTEIRDSERNVLTSKTHAKGTKLTVSGQPPFRFTIGNARNVTLTRDGTPVDLGTRIGAGDVAKFTLE